MKTFSSTALVVLTLALSQLAHAQLLGVGTGAANSVLNAGLGGSSSNLVQALGGCSTGLVKVGTQAPVGKQMLASGRGLESQGDLFTKELSLGCNSVLL